MGPQPTRANDDRLLEMLARRHAGETTRAIGARFGVDFGYVARSTDKVAEADMAESGEPVSRVARAYAWPRRTRKSDGGR
jgi:class 3 adenylate cyclase